MIDNLSANARQQIRRSLRAWAAIGPLLHRSGGNGKSGPYLLLAAVAEAVPPALLDRSRQGRGRLPNRSSSASTAR